MGQSGNDILKIEKCGEVKSVRNDIGFNRDSTGFATVTGEDSRWKNSGDLRVGSHRDTGTSSKFSKKLSHDIN